MVPVDESEVEAATFREKSGQRDLGRRWEELDQRRQARLVEDLQSAIREPCCLVWIEGDVVRIGRAVGEQSFANEERCDPIAEADFEGLPRAFADHPVA